MATALTHATNVLDETVEGSSVINQIARHLNGRTVTYHCTVSDETLPDRKIHVWSSRVGAAPETILVFEVQHRFIGFDTVGASAATVAEDLRTKLKAQGDLVLGLAV